MKHQAIRPLSQFKDLSFFQDPDFGLEEFRIVLHAPTRLNMKQFAFRWLMIESAVADREDLQRKNVQTESYAAANP